MWAVIVAVLALCLNLACIFYMVCTDMKITRKYQHILYLDVVNAFMELMFLVFVSYRLIFTYPRRVMCVFINQLFTSANITFVIAIISLSTDCLIAVIYPLQYRTIVTASRTVKANAWLLSFLFVTFFIFPMSAFSWRYRGYTASCDPKYLFSVAFIAFMGFVAVLLFLTVVVLNFCIVIAAAHSLVARKKITGKSASVHKKVMRLFVRMLVILFFNIGLSVPLLLLSWEYKILADKSLSYLLFYSIGIWNNVIFVFGDNQIRNRCFTKCNAP